MGVDAILRLIDFLMARGFDATRWAQERAAIKQQLEDWHAAGTPEEEKIAALDAKLASIHGASDVIQGR